MYKEHYKNFEKMYLKLVARYGEYATFYNFVKMSAIAIYNSFAKNQEMEQDYLQTINSYEKEEQQLFPKMLGELIMMYQEAEDIKDILGSFYEKENLGNSHIGQFFTPSHISDFIAKIFVQDDEKLNKALERDGFISVCEPACRCWWYDFIIC